MARRNDHSKEELQSMAIDATRSLISQAGYEGVSARKVANSIGYTVGTLYQNFNGIQDLILHANAFTLSSLLLELEEAYNHSASPRWRIEKVALAYLDFAQRHEKLWHAVYKLTLPQDQAIPDWYQSRIDALFSLLENALTQLDGKRSTTDIQKASRILWSSVHGICILHVGNKLFSDNIASPQELIESLIQNYLAAWLQQGTA